jgi:hypothetical protein
MLSALKGWELFLDCTTASFLFLSSKVMHNMIVEKMEMKKEKGAAGGQRQGAIRGGGDSDSDEGGDGGGAPQAVPLVEDRPKVAKAAAGSSMRRRHA